MRSHFPLKRLGYAAVALSLLLALYMGATYPIRSGDQVGGGIPVSELSTEYLGPSRDDLRLVPLAALRSEPVREHLSETSEPSGPRKIRVEVIREDAETTDLRRGRGLTIELPAGKNDVLTALNLTGGLPGPSAHNEVVINRKLPGGTKIIRIPLRVKIGDPIPFSKSDVVLEEGDIVFIEARDTEVYYVGGLMPSKQLVLPRDYDLRAVQAVALANGPIVNGLGVNNLSGTILQDDLGNTSARRLSIVRRTESHGLVTILVDLKKASADPRENIIIQPGDLLVLQEPNETTPLAIAWEFLRSTISRFTGNAEAP
jgi:hypothetical protein